jgi:hypothetical protein
MKPFIPYSLLAAAALCGVALGQSATTTPVGYITIPIGGNSSGSALGASTFIGSSLVNSADFAGAAVSSPSGGKVITFSGGVPADLDGASQLEITSGSQAGWWTTITASTATTITVADDFPSGLDADVKVAVRKFTTVKDLLGDNAAGLDEADEVLLLDPVEQTISTLVYFDGWFNFVTEEPADGEIIYPGGGIVVVRKGPTSLSLVQTGEVKTTPTQVDVYPGVNWLAQPNPTGGTFASMQFATQILESDFLQVVNPDAGSGQSIDSFVAFDGVMFDFVTEEDASTKVLDAGSGYLIVRSSGGAQSVITIPAQVVGN